MALEDRRRDPDLPPRGVGNALAHAVAGRHADEAIFEGLQVDLGVHRFQLAAQVEPFLDQLDLGQRIGHRQLIFDPRDALLDRIRRALAAPLGSVGAQGGEIVTYGTTL